MFRQVLPLGDARGLRPAKRRPVCARGARLRAFGRADADLGGDVTRGNDLRLFSGRPCAVVENHSARHAIIRDQFEADALAVNPHSITSGAFATFRRFGRDQLDLISLELPIAAQRGPAIAFKFERAVVTEARGENAELQWRRRKLYVCLLVCAHRLGIAGNCDRQRDRKTKSAKKHYFHFRSIVSEQSCETKLFGVLSVKAFALSLRSRRQHKAWGVSPRAR